MTKVMTICGTRPEFIRLSEIIKKLDKYTNHILVNTNQSFDYNMSQIFFDELKIREPDYILDVKSETVGEQIGKILTQCEAVLLKEKPDAVFILGDTNSALSCIVAKRLKVPIFHAEAGNRCFDDRVPEEINRRIVDHTSDINLCYTEHSRRNLLREGLHPQDIFVVGSPLPEVYLEHKQSIEDSRILEDLNLEKGEYFLASIHREENVDNESNFQSIIKLLYGLYKEYKMPVIFSTHPRTRNKIEKWESMFDKAIFHKPFGMADYIKLQLGAFCNLSDSGTISEDAAILGISAINIRESNERPEAYDMGNLIMAGVDSGVILNAVKLVTEQKGVRFDNPYEADNFSDKVVRLIVGLHKIVKQRKYHL